jgi:hypothetical protein
MTTKQQREEKVKKVHLRSLRLVSGPKLSVKNKIQATGSLAVPALRSRNAKLVGYVDNKEDPLIQIVRTHQNSISSAGLQIDRRLKTELKRGTTKVKDSTAEMTKER